MAHSSAHRIGSSIAIGLPSLIAELKQGEKANFGRPLIATTLATLTASLPDVIEPATNPYHRQFFHSVAFASLLGYGLYRLYKWEAQEEWQRAIRFGGLVIGGSYLFHLALDACTPSSLALV